MNAGVPPSSADPAPAGRLRAGLSGRMMLASGLLMLILAVPFSVLLVTVADLRAAEHAAQDSEELLATANELERLIVDLETSVRGFVITGTEEFLQPWNVARSRLPASAAALDQLSAREPEQARRAGRIAEAAHAYVQDYAVPLLSAARRGDPTARSVATTAEGKRRLDAIRADFTDFIATERNLVQMRQERSDREASQAVLTAVGGLATSMLLVLAFAGYLSRAIVRPVQRAAQMAMRLAGGDLGTRMPATGAAEIGHLQRAFNQMAGSLERNRDQLAELAAEQAALRRVATLVAHGVSPAALFATVAEEVGRILPADLTFVCRYDADDTSTVVAGWSATGDTMPAGRRYPVTARSLGGLIRQTGHLARMDSYAIDAGTDPPVAPEFGIRSGVAAPITVQGRLWGFVAIGSVGEQPPPPGTESRLADFTELVATAIANAQAQAELTASRARIVASADQTRRRIERDLHDGAQQRLVSLALQVRAAQAAVPPQLAELQGELDHVAGGLTSALEELREISRGIHPAILAEGGLAPALRTLARRSPVPVTLELGQHARLPERVEVAAYYMISEALTNVAKHADASTVRVGVEVDGGLLRLAVRDDGVGGADPSRGSGLIGLKDRVEATGGTLTIDSRHRQGTSLLAELPVTPAPPGDLGTSAADAGTHTGRTANPPHSR